MNSYINFLCEFFLLNSVEAIFALFACLYGTKFREYGLLKVLIVYLIMTVNVYFMPILLIPPIGQIIYPIINSVLIMVVFNIDLKEALKRYFMVIIIMLLIEVPYYIIVKTIFGFDIFMCMNPIYRFLSTLIGRFIEFYSIFKIMTFERGDSMKKLAKTWFFGTVKRREKTENK